MMSFLNSVFSSKKLDRPIFLVGSGKSGTTVLGLLISFHPDVGPKSPHQANYIHVQEFLDAVLNDSTFNTVAHEMEDKLLWDQFFPIHNVPLRQGKELIIEKDPLNFESRLRFKNEISKRSSSKRFISKQPFNTYRVKIIRQYFKDAKFIAIHRDGRDVIASWGRKQDRWNKFGGYENAIKVFAEKWLSSINYIEDNKQELNIYTLKYEDLICDTKNTLMQVFEFCELEYVAQLFDNIKLRDDKQLWKSRIPTEFHQLLLTETYTGLERLNYL